MDEHIDMEGLIENNMPFIESTSERELTFMINLYNLKQSFNSFDANYVRENRLLQNDRTLLNSYHDVSDELFELEDEISQLGIHTNRKTVGENS